jgi:hypothetical protein
LRERALLMKSDGGVTTMVTPSLRAFAQQLLDYETREGDLSISDATVHVCEKLRRSLSALAGVTGYRVLLARALTLAKADVPWLGVAQVNADGVLVGLGEVDPQLDKHEVTQGEVVLIAHLVALLVGFVGEDLTVSLVREVWPTAREFVKDEKEEDHHE